MDKVIRLNFELNGVNIKVWPMFSVISAMNMALMYLKLDNI